jgi:hypothetical protein
MHVLLLTLNTTICLEMSQITKVHKRAQAFVYTKDYAAPIATIASRWSTFCYILFTPECNNAIAAIPCFYINFRFIHKHMSTS